MSVRFSQGSRDLMGWRGWGQRCGGESQNRALLQESECVQLWKSKEEAQRSGSGVLEDQQSPSNLSEKAGTSGHQKDFTGKLGKSLCVAEILSVCRPPPAIWWWASISRWASEPRVRKKCWMQKRARNPLDLCCHPSFTWQPTKPWRVMALQIPVCSSLGQL